MPSVGWAVTEQTKPLISQALYCEEIGKYKEAISLYLEVLKYEPNSFEATNSIAGLYGSLKNFPDEILWANKAIRLSPANFKGYMNLGNGLASKGQDNRAESAFKKSMALAPTSPLPPYSLGLLSEQRGKYSDAQRYYEESIKLDPRFQEAYLNLAALNANQKNFGQALEWLDRLLKLNPRNADALDMKRAVLAEQK